MASEIHTFVCKSCQAETKIPVTNTQNKAFCYSCGSLLFSRGVAQESKEPINMRRPKRQGSKRTSKFAIAKTGESPVSFDGLVLGGLWLSSFVAFGLSYVAAFWVLFVISVALTLFVRAKWNATCPKCNATWEWKTVNVSDTPIGHTTHLESYDNNFGQPDTSPDVRYSTRLMEYGKRKITKRCGECGHSNVTHENYQKSF